MASGRRRRRRRLAGVALGGALILANCLEHPSLARGAARSACAGQQADSAIRLPRARVLAAGRAPIRHEICVPPHEYARQGASQPASQPACLPACLPTLSAANETKARTRLLGYGFRERKLPAPATTNYRPLAGDNLSERRATFLKSGARQSWPAQHWRPDYLVTRESAKQHLNITCQWWARARGRSAFRSQAAGPAKIVGCHKRAAVWLETGTLRDCCRCCSRLRRPRCWRRCCCVFAAAAAPHSAGQKLN